MSEEALAIVFSPNLLRSPIDDFAMIMSNMGSTIKIIRALITHVCPHNLDSVDAPTLMLLISVSRHI
jgi:hypothetical protein